MIIDGIIPKFLSFLTILLPSVYLIYKYYSGDSLTKFMSTPREKILVLIFKNIGILLYDLIIATSLFGNLLESLDIPVSELKKLDKDGTYMALLCFILVYLTIYALSLYLLYLLDKYILYNNHTIIKSSNFYIILNNDINSEFKKNDQVYFSIPSKKEILCYKIIKIDEKTDYLKIYLPTEFVKKHTIFTEKKPSPVIVRDKNRNTYISNIKKNRYGVIPIWLLLIMVILFSIFSVYNIFSAPKDIRILLFILYIPLIFWLWITLWWTTGKEVFKTTYKYTFNLKTMISDEKENIKNENV